MGVVLKVAPQTWRREQTTPKELKSNVKLQLCFHATGTKLYFFPENRLSFVKIHET